MKSAYIAATIAFTSSIATLAGVVFVLVSGFTMQGGPPEPLTPTVNITVYARELPGGLFGWGLSSDNVTSPGPSLRFKVGDVVKVTVVNLGKIPHSFAVVSDLSEDAPIMFNAYIGTRSRPLPPGESGSVVFRLDRAGMFHYLCNVPGHSELGMHGEVIVSPD